MRIQTKFTGFFLLALAVFAFVLVWIGTRSYRNEIRDLNVNICRNRLSMMLKDIRSQEQGVSDNYHEAMETAQEKAIRAIRRYPMENSYEQGFPIILDKNGRVIYHPEIKQGERLPVSPEITYRIITRRLGEEYPDGSDILIYRHFTPWEWIVVYTIPFSDKLRQAALETYFRQIFAVLGCMLVFSALFIWMIQRTLAPLEQLADDAAVMSRGKFPEPRKARYASDEIGVLYRIFYKMSEEIEKNVRNLQGEIVRRRQKEHDILEIIENSPLAIAIINPDNSFYLNNLFIALFGYTSGDIASFDDWFKLAFPNPDYHRKVLLYWDECIKRGNRKDSEADFKLLNVTCKSGKMIEVEFRFKQVDDFKLLVFNDLTERRKAEKELASTRNYLNQVFNSINPLLISIDGSYRIVQWNRATELFTGIKAREAVGFSLWDKAEFLESCRGELEEAVAGNSFRELYRIPIQHDQEEKFFNISINPMNNYDIHGTVIILEDATELVRQSGQLMQAQKMEMVGNLAGGLAHDFNNILAGIKGAVSMIRYHLRNNSRTDNEELGEYADIADKSVHRAANTVDQLLALSRKSSTSFKPVNLKEVIGEVIEICRNTLDKSIEINMKVIDEDAVCLGDPTQLEQMLLNLCINAEHAMTVMREDEKLFGGALEIRLARADANNLPHEDGDYHSYWKITVCDTGIGIPKANIGKIFDPFFTTKGKGKGTGLGLSMVYNIVSRHKGIIDVNSVPGRGSTFIILLPVFDGAMASDEYVGRIEEPIKGHGKILVVDDEAAVRNITGKMLNALGYETILATDGIEGCEIFGRMHGEIDAVLLDMAMPRKSGLETFEDIRKIDPQVKVLFASGYEFDVRVQKAMEGGANQFIRKPFSMAELGRKLKMAMQP